MASRKNNTFSIASIDQPQIAEELTWAAKARGVIRKKMSGEWLDEYWQSVMDRAKQGDRTACQQIDRMLGIGQPIKIEVHGHLDGEQGRSALEEPLAHRLEHLLLNCDQPETFAVLAARLRVTEQDVAQCVRSNLAPTGPFHMTGGREVILA